MIYRFLSSITDQLTGNISSADQKEQGTWEVLYSVSTVEVQSNSMGECHLEKHLCIWGASTGFCTGQMCYKSVHENIDASTLTPGMNLNGNLTLCNISGVQ